MDKAPTTRTRTRRTQEERTAETRGVLIAATVRVIEKLGYGGASTALIAEEAGVSRGAILHHFGTRAQLMADVVEHVYEAETREYRRLYEERRLGRHIADWPELLWTVLSKPSGVAVLEILQATRSDAELAARVLPLQAKIETTAMQAMTDHYGITAEHHMAAMRLLVWAVRGLSIAQVLVGDRAIIDGSIDLLSRLIRHAAPSGSLDQLYR